MAIYIMALERGGFTASGGAWYDGRSLAEGGRCVRLEMFDDEVIDVTVDYSNLATPTPTETDYEESGIDISTPQISGNTVTFQIQGLAANGAVSLTAMFSTGAQKRLSIVANQNQQETGAIQPTDDDDVDYGAFG